MNMPSDWLRLDWLEYAGGWLALAGSLFVLTGAIGLLRLPDIFTRIHAASLKDSMGLPLIVGGLMLIYGWHLGSLKLLILLGFVLITSAAASHALAKSAWWVRERKAESPPKRKPASKRKGGAA